MNLGKSLNPSGSQARLKIAEQLAPDKMGEFLHWDFQKQMKIQVGCKLKKKKRKDGLGDRKFFSSSSLFP